MIIWAAKTTFPSKDTLAYRLIELTAICGELPADILPRLNSSTSYLENVMRTLKSDNLIRLYSADKVKGYRLSKKAKDFLLRENPARFELYLSGNAETNQLKSELVRRLRLHRLAEMYVLMMDAGIPVYRDLKPDVFSPDGCRVSTISKPAFYTSREIKQMGMDTIKISGSRITGSLLTADGVYLTYNGGYGLAKMDYRAEQRAKALLTRILCYDRLTGQYKPEQVAGLMIGKGLNLFSEILAATDSYARFFFLHDGSYEHFYYLTNDHYGQVLLKLLSDKSKITSLNRILAQDLCAADPGLSIVNDAIDPNGDPVLFGYLMDIPRINRFCNGLSLHRKKGTLICFDFQSEVLQDICGNCVRIQAIRFDKFEGSFFNRKK